MMEKFSILIEIDKRNSKFERFGSEFYVISKQFKGTTNFYQ